MHNLTDRIAHTTVFVTAMKDRSTMKDRSDDTSNHERTLLPRSYSSLPVSLISTKHYIVIFSSRVGLVRTCDVIEVSLARVVATQSQEELKHETQSAHRLLKSGRQEKNVSFNDALNTFDYAETNRCVCHLVTALRQLINGVCNPVSTTRTAQRPTTFLNVAQSVGGLKNNTNPDNYNYKCINIGSYKYASSSPVNTYVQKYTHTHTHTHTHTVCVCVCVLI